MAAEWCWSNAATPARAFVEAVFVSHRRNSEVIGCFLDSAILIPSALERCFFYRPLRRLLKPRSEFAATGEGAELVPRTDQSG
jgi:hypothetical protein